jgi:hypothetical protein
VKRLIKLFKEKYYDNYINEFANSVITYSINASLIVILLWENIKTGFYDRDLKGLVDKFELAMGKRDFKGILSPEEVRIYNDLLVDNRFAFLVIEFYKYYSYRIPLLREIKSKPGNKCISINEINDIRDKSLEILENIYPQTKAFHNKTYRKFINFTIMPRFIRSILRKKYDDEVYDDEWFWKVFDSLYPESAVSNNVNHLLYTVISGRFPIFWDSFSNECATALQYAFWLGHVRGTMDTDELIFEYNKIDRTNKIL